MLLLFSAQEVTVAFPSQVSAVCARERGKGEVEKRVVLCTYVGSFKKKSNHLCACRIYIVYPEDSQSKESCQAR